MANDDEEGAKELDKEIESLAKKGKMSAVMDYSKFFKPLDNNGINKFDRRIMKNGMKNSKKDNARMNPFKMKRQNMGNKKMKEPKKSPFAGMQQIMKQKKTAIMHKILGPLSAKKVAPVLVKGNDSQENLKGYNGRNESLSNSRLVEEAKDRK